MPAVRAGQLACGDHCRFASRSRGTRITAGHRASLPVVGARAITGEVQRLVLVLDGQMSRVQIQQALGLRHEDHFRAKYLIPALQSGFVEMTIPDRPKSSRQQYRLTAKAEALRAKLPK